MLTQCSTIPLEFEPHGRRMVADFDGGPFTSDAGLCLPIQPSTSMNSASKSPMAPFTAPLRTLVINAG